MTDEEIQAAIQEAVDKATGDLAKQHEADIAGLKSKNSDLISKNKKLADAADELETATAEASGNIESLKSQHQKMLDKIAAERDEAMSARNTLLVDNVIQSDLAKHNVASPFRSILQDAWKTKAKVENNEAMIDGQPISDFIAGFVSSDEGKHYVSAPKNSGGGAIGSTSSQSTGGHTKDSFTITEFSKLAKENPAEANATAERLGLNFRV